MIPRCCALLAWLASGLPVSAAMLEGSKPQDWPADASQHQVVVRREAADEKQSAMIAAAEAAQAPQEALNKAAGEGGAAKGDKVWWYQEQLGIRIPFAITGDAVAYYSELVGKYGKQTFTRYMKPSSRLDYHAAVTFQKEFKLGDETFKDVYVVTLKLSFEENFAASTTEAMSFKKDRTVILDADGNVLHIEGDGETEAPMLAI